MRPDDTALAMLPWYVGQINLFWLPLSELGAIGTLYKVFIPHMCYLKSYAGFYGKPLNVKGALSA